LTSFVIDFELIDPSIDEYLIKRSIMLGITDNRISNYQIDGSLRVMFIDHEDVLNGF
jgi:hypothetical protein